MTGAARPALPRHVEGYGPVSPFAGAFAKHGAHRRAGAAIRGAPPRADKQLASLDAAIEACELRDGAVLSFHHHLRNGDGVLNAVLDAAARRGLKDLTVAATSLFPVHAPLIEHMRAGVVTGVTATFVSGPVGEAISRGVLARPALLRTHGGRARAIEAGEQRIDAAFVAAPSADRRGNINGVGGPSACGVLGYPRVDAAHADYVVAVTDHLAPYPNCPIEISQDLVDFVVAVDSIGDPAGIVSGATRPTEEPVGLRIAQDTANLILASGLLVDGFSFQTGAGGISLAAARAVGAAMAAGGVRGGFASGGVTGAHVAMLEAGLFRTLLDVQCFDLEAVDSFRRNPAHQGMSASLYANPHNRGAVVDQLDVVILGAAEVDLAFNVNVATKADGVIMGGSGGHADTAAGAKLALVTTRLTAAGFPKLVERVGALTTPGETIDAVITEAGVALNPRREDLAERLRAAGTPLVPIEHLAALARAGSAAARPPQAPRSQEGPIVAVLEYRDGTVTDVIRRLGP